MCQLAGHDAKLSIERVSVRWSEDRAAIPSEKVSLEKNQLFEKLLLIEG
jgi:hypothetical protein